MPGQTVVEKRTLLENLGPFVLVWESLSVVSLCLMQGLGLPTGVDSAGIIAAIMAPVAGLALWQLERTFVATGMVTLNDPDTVASPAE